MKFIYMLKIHMKKISIFNKQTRKYRIKLSEQLEGLLNTLMIWMIFTKILKTTQTKLETRSINCF